MGKIIFYFVDDVETSFVMKDIWMIAERFESVFIFSTEPLEGKENLPSNVVTVEQFMDWKTYDKRRILFSNLFRISSIYLMEVVKSAKFYPIKKAFAVICSNIFKAGEVLRHIRKMSLEIKPDTIFYSFWFYDCIYLAWLKEGNTTKAIVCRAHGGDLFEERSSLAGNILFRNYQLRHFNRVFSVSETGTRYLQEKYPAYKDKIETSYLGSHDHPDESPFNESDFILVSCAKVRDIKRVHVIAEALMHIDFPLTWYHLGDENLSAKNDPSIALFLESREKLKSKPNIRYVNYGEVVNEEIYNFYRHNGVNLFISVSAAEGIPVSMMEAISFGIPVLSTDVGGCKEIVNDQTGILIPLESGPVEIAKTIRDFRQSGMNSPSFRKNVRKFWQMNFNERKNYPEFFKKIEASALV